MRVLFAFFTFFIPSTVRVYVIPSESSVRDLSAQIAHDVAHGQPESVHVPVAPSRSMMLHAARTDDVVRFDIPSTMVVGESTPNGVLISVSRDCATHISLPRISRCRVSPVVTILYVLSGVRPGKVHLPFTGSCGFQILTHSGVWS